MKYLVGALLLGVSFAGFAGQAMAADLIVAPEDPVVAPAPSSTSIYVQLLGGVVAGLDDTYFEGDDPFDYGTEAGLAIAGTIGVVVMDGLSVEGDILYTSRSYAEPDEDDTISTLSLMANLKYTAALTDAVSIYGAVGLGLLSLDDYIYDDDATYNYSGAAYQLILGASMAVSDNISIVGEVRYQDTFEAAPYSDDDYYALRAPVLAALAGVKLAF